MAIQIQKHDEMEKQRLVKDFNKFITCTLCNGYLIEATTIIECLHSFCKSCLVKYLETNKYCPTCEVQIHKARPLLHVKPDQTLQDIVYKLVPDLYGREMQKRRHYYSKNLNQATDLLSNEDKGIISEGGRLIFSPNDKFSLSIEVYPGSKHSFSSEQEIEDVPHRRYLYCHGTVQMMHLKKLIKQKYDLRPKNKVTILYLHDKLKDHYTVLDVAYIYSWTRNSPLRLFYSIKGFPSFSIEKPIENNNLAALDTSIEQNQSSEEPMLNGQETSTPAEDSKENSLVICESPTPSTTSSTATTPSKPESVSVVEISTAALSSSLTSVPTATMLTTLASMSKETISTASSKASNYQVITSLVRQQQQQSTEPQKLDPNVSNNKLPPPLQSTTKNSTEQQTKEAIRNVPLERHLLPRPVIKRGRPPKFRPLLSPPTYSISNQVPTPRTPNSIQSPLPPNFATGPYYSKEHLSSMGYPPFAIPVANPHSYSPNRLPPSPSALRSAYMSLTFNRPMYNPALQNQFSATPTLEPNPDSKSRARIKHTPLKSQSSSGGMGYKNISMGPPISSVTSQNGQKVMGSTSQTPPRSVASISSHSGLSPLQLGLSRSEYVNSIYAPPISSHGLRPPPPPYRSTLLPPLSLGPAPKPAHTITTPSSHSHHSSAMGYNGQALHSPISSPTNKAAKKRPSTSLEEQSIAEKKLKAIRDLGNLLNSQQKYMSSKRNLKVNTPKPKNGTIKNLISFSMNNNNNNNLKVANNNNLEFLEQARNSTLSASKPSSFSLDKVNLTLNKDLSVKERTSLSEVVKAASTISQNSHSSTPSPPTSSASSETATPSVQPMDLQSKTTTINNNNNNNEKTLEPASNNNNSTEHQPSSTPTNTEPVTATT